MSNHRPVILITGSSGLIGSALCERLLAAYTVVGFDRPGPPEPPPGVEAVDVDLGSDASVADALREVRGRHGPDLAAVVHLAAYYDFKGGPSPKYEEITVRGTGRILRGLKDFRVGQFVFSSTMLVHAPCPPGCRITEDSPLAPAWEYPASKVRTEELIRRERGEIPAVLLRIAGVYDDWCHSIPLARQIQRIYERWLTGRVYPGDPARGQAFVHLDDVLAAVERCVEARADLPAETALLIGEPDVVSYRELQRAISRHLHGKEWETYRVPKLLARFGAVAQARAEARLGRDPFIRPWMIDRADDHYALDIDRARTLLGWEPRHTLRGTLPVMLDHLKADPERWYRENKLELPAGRRAPGRPAARPAEAAARAGG